MARKKKGGIFSNPLNVFLILGVLFVAIVFLGTRQMGVDILGSKTTDKDGCTTIQKGDLVDSSGEDITPGYNSWGYNYQAHMFNGTYCDAYHDAGWCQPYKDDNLSMKWNDAWLSNRDCDADGQLDRHYGQDSYRGSGAWLTNHMTGVYEENGVDHPWSYFVKIVAAPEDATANGGVWYTADGTWLGPVIWGDFAIVQEVNNDAKAGFHGVDVLSEYGPGFGHIQ